MTLLQILLDTYNIRYTPRPNELHIDTTSAVFMLDNNIIYERCENRGFVRIKYDISDPKFPDNLINDINTHSPSRRHREQP